jgi:hypothetical protein
LVYDDGKLYVITYKRKRGITEGFIIDREGAVPEKLSLPLKEENIFREYPFAIQKGEVYQLIENEDTGQWALRRSKFTTRF